MSAQYAPFPWHTGGTFNPGTPDEHCTIWGPTPAGYQSGDMVAQYVTLADARVIVAAPQMVEALRWLLSEYDSGDLAFAALSYEKKDRIEAARAALAAAGVTP